MVTAQDQDDNGEDDGDDGEEEEDGDDLVQILLFYTECQAKVYALEDTLANLQTLDLKQHLQTTDVGKTSPTSS